MERTASAMARTLSTTLSWPTLLCKPCNWSPNFKPALPFAYHLDETTGIELYDLIHQQQEYTHIPALIFGGDLESISQNSPNATSSA